MSLTVTLTTKNRLTLPKEIRDDLGLKPGDKVEFEKVNGKYIMRRERRSALELAGILFDPDRPALTTEEMDQTMSNAVNERYGRSF